MGELLSFFAGVAVLGGGLLIRHIVRIRKPSLAVEISRFLGEGLNEFPIVVRPFATVDLPNLHLGVLEEAAARGAKVRVLGYVTPLGEHQNNLRELLSGPRALARVGPVQYQQVNVDVDRQLACVQNGLFLLDAEQGRLVAHIRINLFARGGLELQVMASSQEMASGFIEGVLERIRKTNVFRGKVVSLEQGQEKGSCGPASIRFHRLAPVHGDDIILPPETKTLLERNTVGFYRHAGALQRCGRSLRRGILLHGKPGTGKTYTVRWLAQSLEGVTVILLAGEQLGLVKECCQMAHRLAPSLVILEDVDLIAGARDEARHPYFQITLHQLLNEMDGVDSAAEVVFLLTTNRPQAIEPALAARPGRVDQAIEFPLPDAKARRRLFDLYGRGLQLAIADMDRFIAKTDGASPAFIQELMRKAALIAAEEDSRQETSLRVTDKHVKTAMRELVLGGGELTRNLLGFGRA